MYENPPRYSPVQPGLGPPPRPRRRLVSILVLLAVIAGGVFGGSYLFSPEPDVRLRPGIAFARVDGQDVVLVPYERHGTRGLFQELTRDVSQVRLAAVAVTGEILWDEQLSDQLSWAASVLAAGQRYAYLATGSGLVIVELADGSVAAEGLVPSPAAYAYDADGRRVLALNAAGEVLAIGLDQTAPAPVDAATAAAWAGRLSAQPGAAVATGPEAALAGSPERIALQALPFGMPGSLLVRITVDGMQIPVGAVAFDGGQLVIEGGTAVGAATGHVLVEHRDAANGITLSMVTLDTGRIAGSVPVEAPVDRAVVGPNGMTAVVARDELAVAHADGRVVSVDVGATDFFGTPGKD